MKNELVLSSLHKDFESIKKVDENGIEYWEARELMPLLEYQRWEAAEEVIGRAKKACINSGQDVDNHFRHLTKMVKIGSNRKFLYKGESYSISQLARKINIKDATLRERLKKWDFEKAVNTPLKTYFNN